jgi:hypothetical protein
MFTKIQLKNAPEVKRVIQAADPTYRKREAALIPEVTVALRGTYWDEGTHYTYTAVRLDTLEAFPAPQYNPPQFGGPAQTPRCDIPEGVAIVKTGHFCGKTATAYVYLNPANMAKLLPA